MPWSSPMLRRTTNNQVRNIPTATLTGVPLAQVSAGIDQTCVVTSAGAVVCWGEASLLQAPVQQRQPVIVRCRAVLA